MRVGIFLHIADIFCTGDCRSTTCYLGHICQRPDCKHRGGKSFCKIPYASHNASLQVAEYVTGNGGTTADVHETNVTPSDSSSRSIAGDDGSDEGGLGVTASGARISSEDC